MLAEDPVPSHSQRPRMASGSHGSSMSTLKRVIASCSILPSLWEWKYELERMSLVSSFRTLYHQFQHANWGERTISRMWDYLIPPRSSDERHRQYSSGLKMKLTRIHAEDCSTIHTFQPLLGTQSPATWDEKVLYRCRQRVFMAIKPCHVRNEGWLEIIPSTQPEKRSLVSFHSFHWEKSYLLGKIYASCLTAITFTFAAQRLFGEEHSFTRAVRTVAKGLIIWPTYEMQFSLVG